jgi:hypothetical protein
MKEKKIEWFKEQKNEFFKEKPKKITKSKEDFTPERALKTVGGLALLGVGIHLATELID